MADLSETLHKLVLEDTPPVDRLTDCFRNLRNNCASSPEVQNELAQQESVLKDTNTAISMGLNTTSNEEWNICLRISAQFIGNFIVNNPKNQKVVWSQCYSQLQRMARHGDAKLTNISLMVLYNMIIGCPNVTKDFVNDQEFIKIVCESGADGVEFAQYIIEHLISQDVDWEKVYTSEVPCAGRLFVLDVVENCLKQSHDKVPVKLVNHLTSEFIKGAKCILRTKADLVDNLEPVEVATLLQLLASCSSDAPHLQVLQENKNFFINCAFLLRSIHSAGKEENSCFSAVHKLSALSKADEELQSHPAFGFKANLIRVLGNLCWKNKRNQDLMREVELIPLLLDCCNIDARNPFIIQWVVLAIRNLCESNLENQEVIAGMKREGLVESSVLLELGLKLYDDGENSQIHIAPLKMDHST